MKKSVLIFGLIGGAIASSGFFLMFPFLDSADSGGGEVIGYITMFIAFSTIFFGVRSLKMQNENGILSFKSGFLTGLYITIIASVIYALSWMVFYHFIGDGGMMESYFQSQVELVQNNPELTDEMKTQMLEEGKAFKELYLGNPLVMFGMTLMEIFPVGLLVSLIVAFALKKKAN